MRKETIQMFGWLEKWDFITARHMRRTAVTAQLIGECLYDMGEFPELLTEEYLKDLGEAALLHDCGKTAVPMDILRKEEKLLEQEYELIKRHTIFGRIYLEGVFAFRKKENFCALAVNGACFHHERMDGKGYPCGLAGNEIPLSARIIAVADVFDALSFQRSYKAPCPFPEVCRIMEEGSGSQFDPAVIEAFRHCRGKIQSFSEKCSSY